ncbi:MAG TPA: DUF3667 domain-containing protein, partial [Chitinophagaceae bacterium]|nr:DUF3667 domain-containing protein [Chitinophagaceae bacterium]
GFLSKEYMIGRRASYLHPVRMYVFTSAMFFLLFFSLFNGSNDVVKDMNKPLGATQRTDFIHKLEKLLQKDTGNTRLKDKLALVRGTTRPFTSKDTLLTGSGKGIRIDFANKDYRTFEEYDSAEKALPFSKRDGWFLRRVVKKSIEISNKYRENPQEALDKFAESILHRLPYMLFISLPLFALILRLVYIRRKWRRQFYFADHGVFTIHLYIFSFIVLIVGFGLGSLRDLTGWSFLNFLIFILFIALFFYLYKAMRNFYGQGRGKTFLKFLFVAFWSFIMMLILLVCFMFFSAATL